MNIGGIGIVFARGRGIDSYRQTLEKGWSPPSLKETPFRDRPLPAYCVSPESLTDKIVLKKVRRADRLSKMAVLAAWDAIADSKINLDEIKSSLGIIVATAFGAHATTFRFLDDILEYGDSNVSPTTFSNSVHNAVGSYIAAVLDSHGPTLTLAQFAFSFHQALILAQSWLKEKRCENVLVGSVDEYAKVMGYICSRKLRIAEDGKIRPFQFSETPLAVPGEGSAFFLIRGKDYPNNYCKVSRACVSASDRKEDEPDIYIFDADGMSEDESRYKGIAASGILIGAYTPIFGSMMAGSSFSCAAAALMLKAQIRYASPVVDNPHFANLCTASQTAVIDKIYCVKYNCGLKKAIIELEK
ncbi:MAG: beta-ketoacyl synthase N-terminal-like domain-containing protein [Candidatus Omnitrophota bacterium]